MTLAVIDSADQSAVLVLDAGGAGGDREAYNQVYRPWEDHGDRGADKGGVILTQLGKPTAKSNRTGGGQ